MRLTDKQREQFNAPLDEAAGIIAEIPKGSYGPNDLAEFLECLKIEIESIDSAKRNVIQQRNDPNSTIEQRGASYMLESSSKESLYQFVKQYLHWYL